MWVAGNLQMSDFKVDGTSIAGPDMWVAGNLQMSDFKVDGTSRKRP